MNLTPCTTHFRARTSLRLCPAKLAVALCGWSLVALAGDGFSLTRGRIEVTSNLGGQGDVGYSLTQGRIASGTKDAISLVARLAACTNWDQKPLPSFCATVDFDSDEDVDLFDFAQLQIGFKNPG